MASQIIYFLAHLGISIGDAKYMSLDTLIDLMELHSEILSKQNSKDSQTRDATQDDINKFFGG